MAPQTVLITGCSSGIGLATAVLLAKQEQHEFKVYATMRNLGSKGNLESAAGDTLNETLFIRELDVTKDATILKVVDEILLDNGRVDALVNVAGNNGWDVADEKPLEWCQSIMDTNYWGVVRTIRAVLPAMKKQKSGRILNVTSAGGFLGSPFMSTYSSSKFAVEGFSESMAPVLRDGYNIRVSMVEPGPVDTPMFTRVASEQEGKVFDDILAGLHADHMKMFDSLGIVTQSSEEIAQLLLEILRSEIPHLRYQTSEFVAGMAASRLRDPTSDALLEVLKHKFSSQRVAYHLEIGKEWNAGCSLTDKR